MTKHIIFPGPGKCGTSYIYSLALKYLDKDTFNFPRIKESNYLTSHTSFELNKYLKFYSSQDPTKWFLDFSNTYFFSSRFSSALRNLSDFRMYITLRDPVERVYSHLHQYALSYNYSSLDQALDNHLDVLSRSLYSKQLYKFSDYKDRISFILLNDLKLNPLAVISNIAKEAGSMITCEEFSSDSLNQNARKSSRFPAFTRISRSLYAQFKNISPSAAASLKSSRTISHILYSKSPSSLPSSVGLDSYIRNYFTEEYSFLKSYYGITF